MKFEIYDIDTAPEESVPVLQGVKDAYGFVPNLFGALAESPAAAAAYAALGKALEKAALGPVEQQVVFLAISAENGCEYCMAAHSTLAKGARMPADVLAALRRGQRLPDRRLQALAAFTRALHERRGWVTEPELQAFSEAGYARRHILDVITIVAMKTLSNYANHIAEPPLDPPFADQAWER